MAHNLRFFLFISAIISFFLLNAECEWRVMLAYHEECIFTAVYYMLNIYVFRLRDELPCSKGAGKGAN